MAPTRGVIYVMLNRVVEIIERGGDSFCLLGESLFTEGFRIALVPFLRHAITRSSFEYGSKSKTAPT